MGARYVWIMGT